MPLTVESSVCRSDGLLSTCGQKRRQQHEEKGAAVAGTALSLLCPPSTADGEGLLAAQDSLISLLGVALLKKYLLIKKA